MVVLNILGTVLGILFVLGGGCTVIFWTFGLIEGELGMSIPLIIVGGLIAWGGVAMVRAIWRQRPPAPPPPGTQI